MPRLKGPPRPLPEEEDKGPVTVDISEPATSTEAQPEATRPPEPEVVKVEPAGDDENSLLRQLEELKKSEAASRQQFEAERNARIQAQQQAQKQQQEAQKYRGDAEQGQYDAVLNALGAVQAEAEAAQRDYESALARSDFTSAAQAQRRMARAESRLDRLEEGKSLIEQQRERRTQEPVEQQIQVQPTDQVEAFINNLQGLSGQERSWLKSHREVVTDQAKYARIQAAYYDAIDQGLKRDTPEYFEFLETRLGYAKKKEQPTEEDEWEQPQSRRSPVVSAPPSRDAPSLSTGRPHSSSQVRLTPAEREAAKFSLPHLSQHEAEVEYARQKVRYQKAKAAGEIG